MKIKSIVFALALGTTLGAVSVGQAIDRENGLLKKIFNRRNSTSVKMTAPTQVVPEWAQSFLHWWSCDD